MNIGITLCIFIFAFCIWKRAKPAENEPEKSPGPCPTAKQLWSLPPEATDLKSLTLLHLSVLSCLLAESDCSLKQLLQGLRCHIGCVTPGALDVLKRIYLLPSEACREHKIYKTSSKMTSFIRT